MHSHYLCAITITLFTTTHALSDSATGLPQSVAKRQSGDCPAVWTDVASDLKGLFVGDDGSCTDDARAAIRLAFHDCFPGSCDGSIILSDECTARAENTQLTDICGTLGDKATQYDVGTADMIQFAAALGIVSCPGGPAVSFYAGRTDNSTANPTGQIPSPNDNAASLISQFKEKGFTAGELVALVGAHTTAKQLNGSALDSTVGTWDTDFYTETQDGTAPSSLNSDLSLANASETSETWTSMGASLSAFSAAFVPAMEKMSLLGNDINSLTDCSSVITDAVNDDTATEAQKATTPNTTSSSGTTQAQTTASSDGLGRNAGEGLWGTLLTCFFVAFYCI